MSIAEQSIAAPSNSEDQPRLRDLFLFSAGGRTFGIFSEEVEGTAEAKHPTPLPHAPAAILGVVYARGRMLTLLDPVVVSGGETSTWQAEIPAIISLRGDEQLGLAAEAPGDTITISSSVIEVSDQHSAAETNAAIVGILRHGRDKITVLDPARLFAAATQRRNRRRRRF